MTVAVTTYVAALTQTSAVVASAYVDVVDPVTPVVATTSASSLVSWGLVAVGIAFANTPVPLVVVPESAVAFSTVSGETLRAAISCRSRRQPSSSSPTQSRHLRPAHNSPSFGAENDRHSSRRLLSFRRPHLCQRRGCRLATVQPQQRGALGVKGRSSGVG